jgi:hypothetical protein
MAKLHSFAVTGPAHGEDSIGRPSFQRPNGFGEFDPVRDAVEPGPLAASVRIFAVARDCNAGGSADQALACAVRAAARIAIRPTRIGRAARWVASEAVPDTAPHPNRRSAHGCCRWAILEAA